MALNQKRWLMLASALTLHIIGYISMNRFLGRQGMGNDIALSWDGSIPFIKYFAPFYSIVYVVPVISFFVCWKDYEVIKRAWKAFIWAGLVSLGIFYLYPVEFKLRVVLTPPYDLFENIVRLFYWMDNPPYNCFPSLHVALAFISARSIQLSRPSWGRFFYALAIAIALSTLFVRQHYIMDVIGGLVVAGFMDFCFLRQGLDETIVQKAI